MLALPELLLQILFNQLSIPKDAKSLLNRHRLVRFLRQTQLNQGHVYVAQLIKEELGVLSVVQGGKIVGVLPLEVEKERVNQVLVHDFVFGGK